MYVPRPARDVPRCIEGTNQYGIVDAIIIFIPELRITISIPVIVYTSLRSGSHSEVKSVVTDKSVSSLDMYFLCNEEYGVVNYGIE